MANIGIIGLGNIGSSVYKIVSSKKYLKNRIKIKKVCDIDARRKNALGLPSRLFTKNYRDIINDPGIDTVVELMGGINPARKVINAAIKNSKNVVTANKYLLAFHGKEIFKEAARHKVNIGFEASVCASIPVIEVLKNSFAADEILQLKGIINGTTNSILSLMENQDISFQEALSISRKKGIAEPDPTLDIEGKDSLHKLVILNYLCFGSWYAPEKILCKGIKHIDLLDIIYARELGYTIKLLASSKKEKGSIVSYVAPVLVPRKHPLGKIEEDFNALFLNTSLAGDLLFYGKGAGKKPTSSAVITDILNIENRKKSPERSLKKLAMKNAMDSVSRFYIRFMAKDKPGVLAKISSILAGHKISIASVTQKERSQTAVVPIVMLTHDALYKSVEKSLMKLDKLDEIKGKSVFIRIED